MTAYLSKPQQPVQQEWDNIVHWSDISIEKQCFGGTYKIHDISWSHTLLSPLPDQQLWCMCFKETKMKKLIDYLTGL